MRAPARRRARVRPDDPVRAVRARRAGAWVDRHRRRPLLIATNTARALLLALIPLLALLGVLELWQVLVIAFAVGACTVFFEVGFQSYLPRLVERRPGRANSRLTAATGRRGVGRGSPDLLGAIGARFTIASTPSRSSSRPRPWRRSAARTSSLLRVPGSGARSPRAAETRHNRYLLAFAGEAGTYNMAWHAIEAILVLWAVDHARPRRGDARPAALGRERRRRACSMKALGGIGVGRAMWGSALRGAAWAP